MSRPRLLATRSELKRLVKRLHSALNSGLSESDGQVQQLLQLIRESISRLRGGIHIRELKRLLGTAAVLVGLVSVSEVQAQSFAPGIANPFGIGAPIGAASPTFGDIDGDGDLDMLSGVYDSTAASYLGGLYYYENTGTAQNPQFAASVRNPFGIEADSLDSDLLMPVLADIDADGDLDIVTGGSGLYGVAWLENTGSAQAPSFALPVIAPFGLTDTTYLASPTLLDIDNDGDLDLITGGYYGRFSFFPNNGTAQSPSFGPVQVDPFGLQPTSGFAFLASGDVDWDGDVDLMAGEYYGDILYYENTGTLASPQFAAPQRNVSNIQNNGGYFSFLALADLDGDSDVDLMVSEYVGYYGTGPSAFYYYENTVTSIGLTELDKEWSIFPTLVENELNITGDLDIVEIYITDITGKLVLKPQELSQNKKINLSGIRGGSYMLHITLDNGGSLTKKFLKS